MQKSNQILDVYIKNIYRSNACINPYGLLNGVTGMSLILLSLISDIKSRWEESILLF